MYSTISSKGKIHFCQTCRWEIGNEAWSFFLLYQCSIKPVVTYFSFIKIFSLSATLYFNSSRVQKLFEAGSMLFSLTASYWLDNCLSVHSRLCYFQRLRFVSAFFMGMVWFCHLLSSATWQSSSGLSMLTLSECMWLNSVHKAC